MLRFKAALKIFLVFFGIFIITPALHSLNASYTIHLTVTLQSGIHEYEYESQTKWGCSHLNLEKAYIQGISLRTLAHQNAEKRCKNVALSLPGFQRATLGSFVKESSQNYGSTESSKWDEKELFSPYILEFDCILSFNNKKNLISSAVQLIHDVSSWDLLADTADLSEHVDWRENAERLFRRIIKWDRTTHSIFDNVKDEVLVSLLRNLENNEEASSLALSTFFGENFNDHSPLKHPRDVAIFVEDFQEFLENLDDLSDEIKIHGQHLVDALVRSNLLRPKKIAANLEKDPEAERYRKEARKVLRELKGFQFNHSFSQKAAAALVALLAPIFI